MAAACEWRTRRRGKLGVVSAGAWHVSHLERVSERMLKGRKLIKSGACWIDLFSLSDFSVYGCSV